MLKLLIKAILAVYAHEHSKTLAKAISARKQADHKRQAALHHSRQAQRLIDDAQSLREQHYDAVSDADNIALKAEEVKAFFSVAK